MGTRGLLFVRCCGRYFTYYNRYDSYPEGLGDAIVKEIPEDPDKYREWLEEMRNRYSRMAQLYEEKCLPVDGPKHTLSERCATSFLAIDDRLEYAPTQVQMFDIKHSDIEWTYELDLDRELFSIDGSVRFKMPSVPRDDDWGKYLRLHSEFPPEGTLVKVIGSVYRAPEVSGASRDRYKNLDIQFVDVTILAPSGPKTFSHRIAALNELLVLTHSDYFGLLSNQLLELKAEDFCFREVAYALLSVAAGEFALESPSSLNRNFASEGYFLVPDTTLPEGQQPLLPKLLFECHSPGVESGAAPRSTSYRVGNVLVYLATRIDLADVREASIAEAVDIGLAQGLTSFHAVVFSIVNAILIRVETKGDRHVSVQRSAILRLSRNIRGLGLVYGVLSSSLDKQRGHGSTLTGGSDNGEGSFADASVDIESDLDVSYLRYRINCEEGAKETSDLEDPFKLLVQFFNAATIEHLVDKNSPTVPNEILGSIMRFADFRTSKTMASVSSYCGRLDFEKLRLNDDYTIVDVDDKHGPDGFILEDLRMGKRIPTKMTSQNSDFRNKEGMALSPVIGTATRKSIVASVCVQFTKVTWDSEECTEEVEMPKQLIIGLRGTKTPTNKAYLGAIEKAWGDYIKYHTISAMIHRAQWVCLWPPGYSQLRVEEPYCNGLHVFLRHPNNESAKEWQNTVDYATTMLDRAEHPSSGFIFRTIGRPVIIAFGTRIKLFYFVHHRKEAPFPVNDTSPHQELAACCVEAEPIRRLVQLLPEIDIREPDHKAALENWISTFCADYTLLTEWNPFTGKRRVFDRNDMHGYAMDIYVDESYDGGDIDIEEDEDEEVEDEDEEVEDEDEGDNDQATTT